MKLIRGRFARGIFPATFFQWLGPLIAAGVAMLIIAIIVVTSGMLNLSASTPHPQGWARFLHYVFKRSTNHHARDLVIPADFGNAAQIAKGAGYYGMACSHCHGGPGLGQNPVALSMRPQPQYLMHVLSTFSERELFYIVKHGVKYSAMPSWPVQDRDDEVWSVVSFLKAMPKMSTAQFRGLVYGDANNPAGASAVPRLDNRFRITGYTLPNANLPPASDYQYARPALGFDQFALTGDVVTTCARCHTNGGTGRAGGAVPNLTLLDPTYFKDALTKLATGTRHSGFMAPVATQLSDAQIDAFARYYAAQPARATGNAKGSREDYALGERLVTAGDPARKVGACSNCHGITRASSKVFPAIDGQNVAYLRARMLQFRGRHGVMAPDGNPMNAESQNLTDREINAVSLYYASQQPIARTPLPAAR